MDLIQKRFDELTAMTEAIEASKSVRTETHQPRHYRRGEEPSTYQVYSIDFKLFRMWQTSVLSLLSRVLGKNDPTFAEFRTLKNTNFSTSHSKFDNLLAVFESAKSDYEGGYLFKVRNLANAEVFTDELDQAGGFQRGGHKVAAAVVAGTVLETTLRAICAQHPDVEPSDKINKMNADLAKTDFYSLAVSRQVSAWADIRNAAAHGRPDEFDDNSVARMIDGIRDFMAFYLR